MPCLKNTVNVRPAQHHDSGMVFAFLFKTGSRSKYVRTKKIIFCFCESIIQNNYNVLNGGKDTMNKYECMCEYVYDPAKGDPDNGIQPGTAFEDLPDDWVCPLCGAEKEHFEKID